MQKHCEEIGSSRTVLRRRAWARSSTRRSSFVATMDLDGDVDDGLSLEDLMAQLTTAQETKSTARLSERNVVELVSKLREKGLIGSEENNALLYTVTGREYLMERKLREEVREAV